MTNSYRRMSDDGITALKAMEGYREHAYRDSAALLTIGYGHLLTQSELTSGKLTALDGHEWRNGVSREQADVLLREDLRQAERAVSAAVDAALTTHQFDALVSFVYNVGGGAFLRSTLLRRINAGRFDDVPAELRRWVYSGGRAVTGLENRRNYEIAIWRDGRYA